MQVTPENVVMHKVVVVVKGRTSGCHYGLHKPPQESWWHLTGMLECQDILAHNVLCMVS